MNIDTVSVAPSTGCSFYSHLALAWQPASGWPVRLLWSSGLSPSPASLLPLVSWQLEEVWQHWQEPPWPGTPWTWWVATGGWPSYSAGASWAPPPWSTPWPRSSGATWPGWRGGGGTNKYRNNSNDNHLIISMWYLYPFRCQNNCYLYVYISCLYCNLSINLYCL